MVCAVEPFLFLCFPFSSDYSFNLRSLRKIVEEGKGGREKKSACSQVHDDYITYELWNLSSIFFPLKKKKKKVEQISNSKLVHLRRTKLDDNKYILPHSYPKQSLDSPSPPSPYPVLSPYKCNKVKEYRKRREKEKKVAAL